MTKLWIALYPFYAFLCRSGYGKNLVCHCLNNATCDPNGFCANGCDLGWYGPGCQVGNIALNKNARQSSTYYGDYTLTADLAVDGITDPLNGYPRHCSHTQEEPKQDFAWWYVTLSESQAYVITNISIVNRNDVNGDRLQKFYILYTSDTSTAPDPKTWKTCTYQETKPLELLSTYQCINGSVVAKAVGVYLTSTTKNILTLCEVYVYGYAYMPCTAGYTGPGCLLRACDAVCNKNSGTCADFGGCNFSVCPSKAQLPPDCWRTLLDLSNSTLSAAATCNNMLISLQLPATKPNYRATSLMFNVSTPASSWSVVMPLSFNTSVVSVNFDVNQAQSYVVDVTPLSCSHVDGPCAYGAVSGAVNVTTGKWMHWLSNNDSCIFASINSSNAGCEQPSLITTRCEGSNVTILSQTAVLCGLVRGVNYNCSVFATIRNFTDMSSAIVSIEALQTTTPAGGAGNNIAIIVGCCIGGAILVILVVVVTVVLIRRRKANTGPKSADDSSTLKLPVQSTNDGTASAHQSEADDQTYDNISGMTLPQFQLYIKDEALIVKRFSELQANDGHPSLEGKAPANKAKNRFQNIVPYDANRVCLVASGRDYINASYIDGFGAPRQYIATQGPSTKTIDDFWNMLWQERCSVIVMLTGYIENAKKKCEKYFPVPSSTESGITVSVRSVATYDTHTVTALDVHYGDEIRVVHHYHFLSWPDQSVPEHCADVMLFYSKIRRQIKSLGAGTGPIVVHCSAGVGRTGAYIALDYLQQRYESQGRVDVDSCVVKLRDQRMQMVQTKDQYVFVHKAVLYGMRTLRYVFEASQLPAFVHSISGMAGAVQSFTQEWQELQSCMPPFNEHDFASAVLPENKHKNRISRILAGDSQRPVLARASTTSHGYINAVYCNGCYANRGFIATQLPLPSTVADFWHMVYECQASCIVLLHDLPPDEDCPRYWPEPGHSLTSGTLVVTSHSNWQDVDDKSGVRVAVLGITVGPVSKLGAQQNLITTKLFMPKLWTGHTDELPAGMSGLLDMALAMRAYCRDTPTQPVVVQCRDGASQCGLFLSAVNALHLLTETGQVCAFHVVDLLRARRREFVKSEAQYRFVYQFLNEYSEASAIYANA